MKALFFIITLCTLAAASGLQAFVNGDFESGDLSGWTVTIGGTTAPFGTQIAVTETSGPAPNTNGNLNEVYSGTYACKLDSGTGMINHAEFARISQSDVISPANAILEFYYAAVLDGSHALSPGTDAYMTVEILNGAAPIVTRQYYYASSPAPLIDDGVPLKKHLPWTQILLDLSPYIGLTITVQFTAYDCGQGGHNSVAYVDGFHFIPPTPTVTPTPSITPTHTYSPTITPSFSITPSFTITQSHTYSPTITKTYSFTATPSFSHTPTITYTPSITPSFTITNSHTATPTITATPSVTPSFTSTPRPLILKLLPPSPNPTTQDYIWIPWFISVDSDVDIDIYTVAGERVRHLDKEWNLSGYGERKWDLKNDSSRKVATGTFIYRVRATSARGETENDFAKCAIIR